MFKNIKYDVFLILGIFLLMGCSKKDIIEKELKDIKLPKETKYTIELPLYSPNLKLEIDWETSDEGLVDVLGNVYLTEREKEVILTANISGFKREFIVKILKNNLEYYAYFDQAYEQVRENLPEFVRENLVLPPSLPEYSGLGFKYYSNRPNLLSDNGEIKRDLYENKKIKFYTKLSYEKNSRIYLKEIEIERYSDAEKMTKAKEYVQNFLKGKDLKTVSVFPNKYEEYDVALNWYTASDNLINLDGTVNKTFEPVRTKLTCEIKIGNLTEKITVDYNSMVMNQLERNQHIEVLLNQYYSKTNYAYASILNYDDLYIRQGIVSPNAPNRPGTLKPVPTLKRLQQAGYNSTPNKDNVLWIVIHDTGNTMPKADASAHNQFVNNRPPTNVSWHYTVDDKSIYQHIPDREIAYHSGDTTDDKGNGNNNGIGIEMCVNQDGDFELTLRHTAKLVARLMIQYNLKISSVQQHNFFSGKNCPYELRVSNRWNEFLEMIEMEYNILNILKEKSRVNYSVSKLYSASLSPFQVLKAGKNPESVTLNMQVNLENFKKSFTFVLNMKK